MSLKIVNESIKKLVLLTKFYKNRLLSDLMMIQNYFKGSLK